MVSRKGQAPALLEHRRDNLTSEREHVQHVPWEGEGPVRMEGVGTSPTSSIVEAQHAVPQQGGRGPRDKGRCCATICQGSCGRNSLKNRKLEKITSGSFPSFRTYLREYGSISMTHQEGKEQRGLWRCHHPQASGSLDPSPPPSHRLARTRFYHALYLRDYGGAHVGL